MWMLEFLGSQLKQRLHVQYIYVIPFFCCFGCFEEKGKKMMMTGERRCRKEKEERVMVSCRCDALVRE